MKRNYLTYLGIASVILAILILATAAFAGPVLICKAIDIGSAQSLPWNHPATLAGSNGYEVTHLVADTLALLNSKTPVLVRMETLRRATIYSQRDAGAAKDLLANLQQRAQTNTTDALAQFDYGYLVACYKQIAWARSSGMTVWGHSNWQNPAAGADGYALIQKAISLRGEDAEMEFAAALATFNGNESTPAHREHLEKALAGAKDSPLLARNLAEQFSKILAVKN